jgi:hypothetical protein
MRKRGEESEKRRRRRGKKRQSVMQLYTPLERCVSRSDNHLMSQAHPFLAVHRLMRLRRIWRGSLRFGNNAKRRKLRKRRKLLVRLKSCSYLVGTLIQVRHHRRQGISANSCTCEVWKENCEIETLLFSASFE